MKTPNKLARALNEQYIDALAPISLTSIASKPRLCPGSRVPQAHLTLQRSITADAPSTDSTAQTMSSVASYSWPSGDSETEYDDEGFYEDSDGQL